jgi:CRP/FNR family transcriptional regulator, cyclic AMP receptor protein
MEAMEMDLIDIQHDTPQTSVKMMNGRMLTSDRILIALRDSKIVDNLREFEINILSELITVRYFEVKEYIVELESDPLKDALMILVEGEIKISATVGNEPVSLHLETPGELARVVSFVGGANMNISAKLNVKKDSAVLLLQRSKLETLLHDHPYIVYSVLRNLVLHMHSVARRNNGEKEEMRKYVYRTQALF